MDSTGISKYTHYIDQNRNMHLDANEIKIIKGSTDQDDSLMLNDPSKTLIKVSDEIRYYANQAGIQEIGIISTDDIKPIINEDAEALFKNKDIPTEFKTSVIGFDEGDNTLFLELAKEPYTLVQLNGTQLFTDDDPEYIAKYRSNRYRVNADNIQENTSNDITFSRIDGLKNTTNKDIYNYNEPFEDIACPTVLGIKIDKPENGTAELLLEFVKPPYSSVSIGNEELAKEQCAYDGNSYFVSFNTLLEYANSRLIVDINNNEGVKYPGFSISFNSSLEQGLRYLGISMDVDNYKFKNWHKGHLENIFEKPESYSGEKLEDILGISQNTSPVAQATKSLQKNNVAKAMSYLRSAVNIENVAVDQLDINLDESTYPFEEDSPIRIDGSSITANGNWNDAIGVAIVLNQDVSAYKYIKMDINIKGIFEDITLGWGNNDSALKVEIQNGDVMTPLKCVNGATHSTNTYAQNPYYISPGDGTIYIKIPDDIDFIEQLNLVIGQAENASVRISNISFVKELSDDAKNQTSLDLDKKNFSYSVIADNTTNADIASCTFKLDDIDTEEIDDILNIQIIKTEGKIYTYPGYHEEGSSEFKEDIALILEYMDYIHSRNESSDVQEIIDYINDNAFDDLLNSGLSCVGYVYSDTNFENEIRTLMSADSSLILDLNNETVKGYIRGAISQFSNQELSENQALSAYEKLQNMYSSFIPANEIGAFGQKSMLVLYKLAEYKDKGIIGPISINSSGEVSIDSLPQQIGLQSTTISVKMSTQQNMTIKYKAGEKTVNYELSLNADGVVESVKINGITDEENQFGNMNLDTTNDTLEETDIKYVYARIYQALISSGDPILQELLQIKDGQLILNNQNAVNKIKGSGNFRSIDSELIYFNKIDNSDPNYPIMLTIEDGKGTEPIALRIVFEASSDNGALWIKNFITDSDSAKDSWSKMNWILQSTTSHSSSYQSGGMQTMGWWENFVNAVVNIAVQWAINAVGGWVINALNEAVKGIEVVQQAMAAVEWANSIKNTAESFIAPFQSAADIIETIKDPQRLLNGLVPKEIVDIKKEIENNIIAIQETLVPIRNTVEELKEEIETNAKVVIKVGDTIFEDIDKEIASVEATVNEAGTQVIASTKIKLSKFAEKYSIDLNNTEIQYELIYPDQYGNYPSASELELNNLLKIGQMSQEAILPQITATSTDTVVSIDNSGNSLSISDIESSSELKVVDGLPEYTISGETSTLEEVISGSVNFNTFQTNARQLLNNKFQPFPVSDLSTYQNGISTTISTSDDYLLVKTSKDFGINTFEASYNLEDGTVCLDEKIAGVTTNGNITVDSAYTVDSTAIDNGLKDSAMLGIATGLTGLNINSTDEIIRSMEQIQNAMAPGKTKITSPEMTKQLAVLSDFIYLKDKKDIETAFDELKNDKPEFSGWEILPVGGNPLLENITTDYEGAFLKSPDNEIIMVNRGTEFTTIQDWATNVSLGAGSSDNQIQVAIDFYNQFKEEYPEYADNQVFHTGHSLGGGIAQALAVWTHQSSGDIAICFSPAGVWNVVDNWKDFDANADYSYIDNYILTSDIVPALLPHVGNLYFEETTEEEQLTKEKLDLYAIVMGGGISLLTFNDIEYALTSHNMDYHIDGFDETSDLGLYNHVIPLIWLSYKLCTWGTNLNAEDVFPISEIGKSL